MAAPKLTQIPSDLSATLMQPRAAVSATLQAAIMLPMGGGTVSTLSQAKQTGIKLIHLPGAGLFIEYKNSKTFTPDANIKDVWYEKDENLK